jgi:hypothetical protein
VSAADDAALAVARRLRAFTDRLLIDGEQLDADIRGRITGARTVRTMDGASSIVLNVDDNDLAVTSSGILSKAGNPTKRARKAGLEEAAWDRVAPARLTLDGWFTRLAGYDFNIAARGSTLELTFEDEIAWLMRRQRDAIVSSRSSKGHPGGEMTRAEFIAMLLQISTKRQVGYVHYFSPEQSVQQQVRKPSKTGEREPREGHQRRRGQAPDDQGAADRRRPAQAADHVAHRRRRLHAGERATLAMLCAGIGESSFRAIMNGAGSPYGGVFQGNVGGGVWDLNDTKGMAQSFLRGGKGFQGGGAIKLATDNTDWTPGHIAYRRG